MELFNTKSSSPISGVFVVQPGEVVVLSAYNFTGSQRAVVQKVKFVDSFVASGAPCDAVINVPTSKIAAVEDVTQCGQWVLNACQNLVVLSVPGIYRLALDDGYVEGEPEVGTPLQGAESTAVGTVIIELERLSVAHAQLIPKDLFFGHISNCAGCNG